MMNVVDALELVLERARSGDVTGVAIACTHGDLSTASTWSMQDATLAEMIGAVTILQHRLLDVSKATAHDPG